MAWHLGPTVQAHLHRDVVALTWPGGATSFELSSTLEWHAHRGEVEPVLGWYWPYYGVKEPTTVLIGSGTVEPDMRLVSV